MAHADRLRTGVRHHLGQGGPRLYIFQSRNELFTDKVFAGLAMVILIGLLFENLVFQSVERITVRRWGMQR